MTSSLKRKKNFLERNDGKANGFLQKIVFFCFDAASPIVSLSPSFLFSLLFFSLLCIDNRKNDLVI